MSEHNLHLISIDSNSLDRRIAENKGSESTDFIKWLFDKLKINPDFRILELCCGTGAQTLEFSNRINDDGYLVGIDISKESILKLGSKIPQNQISHVNLIESDIDFFDESLKQKNILKNSFDLIFCSYGLYYSKDSGKLLNFAKTWLKLDGEIIIVGPYGPNNESLFTLLRSCGVKIPDFVRYTSQDFMINELIPWATLNFNYIQIFTMINNIKWNSVQNVISYWKNSTFFDQNYETIVEKKVMDHFQTNTFFVNQKWVMMVMMKNESE